VVVGTTGLQRGRRPRDRAGAHPKRSSGAWRSSGTPRRSSGAREALTRRVRLDLGVRLPVELTLAGLTPRERVRSCGCGLEVRSDRQSAEQQFVSGKTASVHVTSILANLGVHSRLGPPR
jgi:DNA-binding CsgD family transcriptional regulator